MKQKLTSHLFLLIALTGSFFLSYSCECEQDSKTDPLGRPEISISLQGSRLTEGGEMINSTLTLSLTSTFAEELTVRFIISGEGITREDFTLTAVSGGSQVIFADDATLTGNLTIARGSTNVDLLLTVSDDDLDEHKETLTFTLNDSDSYSVNSSERVVEVIVTDNENRAEVTGFSPEPSIGAITLTWTDPVDMDDLDHVEISWMPTHGNPSSPQQISRGVQTLTITGLISETDYTFTAIGVDSADNRSSGVVTNGIPMNLLTNVHNVSDSGALALDGTFSVTTASVGGTTYLFAAGWNDDGVGVFRVESDGALVNVENVLDTDTLELNGANSVTTASVGSETYLFVAAFNDDGVSVFRVGSDGSLSNVANVSDTGALELDGAYSVTTVSVGGITYLFVAGFNDDGVSAFRVGSDGSLSNVANVSDIGALALDGANSVTTASVGGTTYLFVAGTTDDGVSVFRVGNDGSLSNVANVLDGGIRELDGATYVTTVSVGGITYLFVVGFNDDGVSAFRVGSDGSLSNVANVSDGGTRELDGAYSVTAASVGSETYLFVAGWNDDGVSAFRVGSDGSLSNVANVSDGGARELDGASSVTTVSVGGITYLFVAAFNDDGVSVFRVDPATSE